MMVTLVTDRYYTKLKIVLAFVLFRPRLKKHKVRKLFETEFAYTYANLVILYNSTFYSHFSTTETRTFLLMLL